MRTLAVLSDIHGNYVSLQKCLEYAKNLSADAFVFLGDYLGELAYPQKTMEILYSLREQYPCFFIRGNKEDYWLNYAKDPAGWKEYDSTTGCLYDTYHNLKQKDLEFFRALPAKKMLEFEGLPSITICHGSPRRVNEKMLPQNADTFSIMEEDLNRYILCGHTHIQGKIEHHENMVLNVGAVGVPLHSGGEAQFMILRGEQGAWGYKFVSLGYDREKVIADLHASGLSEKAPYWCKVTEHLLRTGEISHGTVMAKAMEICEYKFGECSWPNIPEECWEQAWKEIAT